MRPDEGVNSQNLGLCLSHVAGDPSVVAECQEPVSGLMENGVGVLGVDGWLVGCGGGWTLGCSLDCVCQVRCRLRMGHPKATC